MSAPTDLPVVVIVGRPNVGKSTLFNRLVGKKLALVDDRPGVTRDRREGVGHLLGLHFRIVDTAGFEEDDPASLPGRMRAQTEAAVHMADVALFLIDARVGVTPVDAEIARWLRDSDTPIIVVANKAEGKVGAAGVSEAYSLGLGEPFGLSAEHGEGIVDLFDALRPHVEQPEEESDAPAGKRRGKSQRATTKAKQVAADLAGEALRADLLIPDGEDDGEEIVWQGEELDPESPLKLAIVGRPNAGKSTLVNRILGEERMITGPEAGLTRDSISIDWMWQVPGGGERPVRLIDTAGLRKRAKVQDKLEKLSVADTLHSVAFAEVVVLMLDATLGLEAQDLRIADRVIDEGRALIIALNKWDVAEDGSALYQGIRAALDEGLAQVKGVPLITVSAATGKGLDQLLAIGFDLREQWSRRVPTGELNRWFERAIDANPPPAHKGQRIKLRYITQARNRPPSFVAFGSRVDMLPESYRRYLVNGIRRELGFGAVPVRLTLRASRNPFGAALRKSAHSAPRKAETRGAGGGLGKPGRPAGSKAASGIRAVTPTGAARRPTRPGSTKPTGGKATAKPIGRQTAKPSGKPTGKPSGKPTRRP
jgi:GTP-binding protein